MQPHPHPLLLPRLALMSLMNDALLALALALTLALTVTLTVALALTLTLTLTLTLRHRILCRATSLL